jgi:DNA-binding PadR family transcriptional regulator
MSALEDIKLEKTRNLLGALALLAQYSSGIHYQAFVPNFIGAIEPLRRKGYVEDVRVPIRSSYSDEEGYKLTDAGWEYARKVLDSAEKII